MKSMTGFGTSSQTTNKVSVSATLRSVNGRYLDIRPHLPRQYQSLEIEIKKLIGKYAARGTVDLYVHRKTLDASASEITINLAMAKQWQDSYKKLAKFLKMDANVRLETIALLNDVVVIEEKTEASEAEKKIVFSVLKSALETFNKERDREGKALKKELLHLLSQLKKSLKSVESMTDSIRKELEKRFSDRLGQFSTGIDIDPQRIAQEVAVAIDKCDIREEISRLNEHLSMFQSLVDNDSEPRGKKLDFYCQELLREFNTIGSKSSQAKLTQTVVDAKSIIEKLREQVQNIE